MSVKVAEYRRPGEEADSINQMRAFHGRGLSSYVDSEEVKQSERKLVARTHAPQTPQPLLQNDGDSSDLS